MNMMTAVEAAALKITIGAVIQYRKIGRAVVTEIHQQTESSALVSLNFLTGPKNYKAGGKLADGEFWISDSDIVK